MAIRINGQNPKKNVPPIVNRSLARGINPWNKQGWSIAFYDVSMPKIQSKRTLRFKVHSNKSEDHLYLIHWKRNKYINQILLTISLKL